MSYLVKSWKQVNWSPPLHSSIEVTATSHFRPTDLVDAPRAVTWAGSLTPISSDGYDSDTPLPQHKVQIFPTRINNFTKRLRSIRPLDVITKVAGSRLIFLATLAILLVWAIIGAVLGPSDVWQIVMQNASSIQCYVSDTLLMRQQFNTCSHFLASIGELRSRNRSIVRMLRSLTPSQRDEFLQSQAALLESKEASQNSEPQLASKKVSSEIVTVFDKICDAVATATGSLPALILFIVGIAVWLGTGPLLSFNNLWQLDINTAVAVQLTFTSMFLQNVRRRHADSLSSTLTSIKGVDSELEWRLRTLVADLLPNQTFTLEPPETTRTERFIDIYAYVVGSGVGVTLSAIVVAVWVGVGHLLHWNSNWWLIIGTYTGLVGFVDGFVLRNVYFRQSSILDQHLLALREVDEDVLSLLKLSVPPKVPHINKKSLSFRISNKTVVVCAHPFSVIGSLVLVVGLLGIATGLLWSETGQLICNTPTMIVEGFLFLVLFQAHNMSNVERRGQFSDILTRRNILKTCVRGYEARHEIDIVEKQVIETKR